jgi:hypothetical protein
MSLFSRVLRRATVRVGAAIARRRWAIAASIFGIAALIAAFALNLITIPTFSEASGPEVGLNRAPDEPEATAMYFQGHKILDARLIWGAYSETYARAMIRQGNSPDRTQEQLFNSRDSGSRLEPHFVATYPTPNGKLAYYAVTHIGGRGGGQQTIPYMFVLDGNGKIVDLY